MAGLNRNDYKSAVNTDYPSASTITAAQHRTHVNGDLADNVCFRLDYTDTQNKTSGAFNIDFNGQDRIETTITGTSGSTVTFQNLEDGDVKYWLVAKSATETIAFAAANDVTYFTKGVTNATSVLYMVWDKDGTEYVNAVDIALYEDWIQPSLNANWNHLSGNEFKYRLNAFGNVEFKGAFRNTVIGDTTPFTLPAGYRPQANMAVSFLAWDTSGTTYAQQYATIKSDGTMTSGDGTGGTTWSNSKYFFANNIEFSTE